MKRGVAAILVCAIAGAGLAFAQAEDDGDRFRPHWEHGPPSLNVVIIAPEAVTGEVVLCCYPRRNRSLDCRVGYEAPRNYSFGYSAINHANYYRMTPESLAEYEAGPHNPIQFRYHFQSGPPPRPAQPAPRVQNSDYACPIARVEVTP